MPFEVIDRHGNIIELDDDTPIPPGCRLRVPYNQAFNDDRTPEPSTLDGKLIAAQRAQHQQDLANLVAGPRFYTDTQRTAVDKARTQYLDRLTSAWKTKADAIPTAPPYTPPPAQLERGLNPALRSMTAAEWEAYLRQRRAAADTAYDKRKSKLTNAWRSPTTRAVSWSR
jgi:hypothetical protein